MGARVAVRLKVRELLQQLRAKEYPLATLGLGAATVAISLFVLRNGREKDYRESDIGRARMETDAILAARVPPTRTDQEREYVSRPTSRGHAPRP